MAYRWIDYLKKDIWRTDLTSLSKGKALKIRFLRLLILISHGFTKSQIQQGASALTYYTLLGIVPIIALLFGVARGFELEQNLKDWLLKRFADQQVVINKLFEFAEASLKQTNEGILAAVGVIVLLWAGIKIFLYLEHVLDTIWEVKRSRSFARRFTDYLAMILLCPLMVFLASGITAYLTAFLSNISHEGTILEHIALTLIFLLNIIPFLVICLLFVFLYIFMPNARVRFLPALWAGLITGVIYQLFQWIYLYFQIGVARYNAIYGTFAAFPLFLVWAHLSWVIILLGSKISFALQNVNAYDFISEDVHLNIQARRMITLSITHLCIKRFCKGEPPLNAVKISKMLSIPLAFVGKVLFNLLEAGVLSEVKDATDRDPGFQPARTVDQLTIKNVLDMIETRGEEISLPPSHDKEQILNCLEKFSQAIERSDGNVLLKEI